MLNRYTAQKPYRGFESPPLRHPPLFGIGSLETEHMAPQESKTVTDAASAGAEQKRPSSALNHAPAGGKDAWDKLSSISTLISGVVIAGLGVFATIIFNERQLEQNANQRNRELAALEIQTVQAFFSDLSSKDAGRTKSALEAISALGYSDLAVKLAINFGGEAAESFLKSQSASTDSATASAAANGLTELQKRRLDAFDEELAYRLGLLNDLFKGNQLQDLVLAEVEHLFEEIPPAEQVEKYMVGGGRFLRAELADQTVIGLLRQRARATSGDNRSKIDHAVDAAERFKSLILSTPPREIQLSEHVVDDIANFDTAQLQEIREVLLPAFDPWR